MTHKASILAAVLVELIDVTLMKFCHKVKIFVLTILHKV